MNIPEMSGPSGIYCIAVTCESVTRFYIGSSRSLRKRLRAHRAKLTPGLTVKTPSCRTVGISTGNLPSKSLCLSTVPNRYSLNVKNITWKL